MAAKNTRQPIALESVLAVIIILATVLGAYSVVLSSSFGIVDDYFFLRNAIQGNHGTSQLLTSAGRPLNGFLLELGFRAAGTVEKLSILRSISLAGICLLGSGLYFFCRAHRISILASMSIACGIVLLPSFQVYSSWAQHFTTPFAGAFALLSSFVLTPAYSMRERSRVLAILLSALLSSIAILIYQPLAMLFCTGILISILSYANALASWNASRITDTVLSFALAMLVGLIAFKWGQNIYPTDAMRYGLVQDIQEKIAWFFSSSLLNVLSLYFVPAKTAVAIASMILLAIGALLLVIRCKLLNGLLIVGYSFLCILGSYIPNLATAENWASYRSIGALAASIVVLIVFAMSEIFGWFEKTPSASSFFFKIMKWRWLLLTILLVTIAIQAQTNVVKCFVIPNVIEINNLASVLDEAKAKNPKVTSIVVIPALWSDSSVKPMAYDEFGMHSSLNASFAKAVLDVVLLSTNSIPDANVIVLDRDSAIETQKMDNSENVLVINFPSLITSQRFKTNKSSLEHSKLMFSN